MAEEKLSRDKVPCPKCGKIMDYHDDTWTADGKQFDDSCWNCEACGFVLDIDEFLELK